MGIKIAEENRSNFIEIVKKEAIILLISEQLKKQLKTPFFKVVFALDSFQRSFTKDLLI